MLDIVFNHAAGRNQYQKIFFAKIIKTALAVLGWRETSVGLSINLVGERRMRFLNKKYRGKDQAADVLSFPLFRKAVLGERLLIPLRAKKAGSDIIELGDVFICLPVIRQRAELENKSPKALLRLLVAHSFLHLLGFDHEQMRKQRVMEKAEQRILQKLK